MIHNPLLSKDAYLLIDALSSCGAEFQVVGSSLQVNGISGKLLPTRRRLFLGNSGIALRFLGALFALQNNEITLTGDASLCGRPMKALGDALMEMGAKVRYLEEEGFAPLAIQGPINRREVVVDGACSQPVSAMLISLALNKGQTCDLKVKNPNELPYIEMTLDWLKRMGARVSVIHKDHFQIEGRGAWLGFEYTVPGDFSSAANPFVASLMQPTRMQLTGLNFSDYQGDKRLFDLFHKEGINFDDGSWQTTPKSFQEVKSIHEDLNDCIDQVPLISLLMTRADNPSSLQNIASARDKECNRITATIEELSKMGASLAEEGNALYITPSKLKGAELDSYGDHRMAMMLFLAAVHADSPSTLKRVACIEKTYPNFLEQMQTCGARFEYL